MKRYCGVMTIALSAILALAMGACQPNVVPEEMALEIEATGVEDDNATTVTESAVEANETTSIIEVTNQSEYSTFNNIDYVKYEGRFISTPPGVRYDAPFEIVAPKDRQQGNGRLLVEPYHNFGGQARVMTFLRLSSSLIRGSATLRSAGKRRKSMSTPA